MKTAFYIFSTTVISSILTMATGYTEVALLLFLISLVFLGVYSFKLEEQYDKCFTKGNLNNNKIIRKAKDLQIL